VNPDADKPPPHGFNISGVRSPLPRMALLSAWLVVVAGCGASAANHGKPHLSTADCDALAKLLGARLGRHVMGLAEPSLRSRTVACRAAVRR
jgi:hypothetical protein